MRSLIAVLTLLMSLEANAVSATSRALLDQARGLGTENRNVFAAQLEKAPRAQLIEALKEGLAAGETNTVATAVEILKVPELAQSLEKVEDASAVLALRSVVPKTDRDAVGVRLLARARSSREFPYRNEVYRTLGAWQIPLSDRDFEAGLKDPVLEVRAAIVDNFLSSHSRLTLGQQVARFREAFLVKPAQVRLEAMTYFLNLPASERQKLSPQVIDAAFSKACGAEANADVKDECARLLKTASEP